MASIFSKIVAGEIPCYKVAEDDKHLAFLDVNPVAPGHVLCIPKREVSYIFDLSDDEFVALQLFSKRVAEALFKAIPCKRIGTMVLGLEVPHAHIHLVPLQSEQDMNFFRPKLTLEPAEMERIAASIAANL